MTKEDTLPKILRRNYEKRGDKEIAMREKKFGIWREYTWKDYYENVKYFSLGLISLGLERGDKVAIIGENAPEGYWAEYAVQAADAVPTGCFTDSIPSEIGYIVNHSDSKFVVADDQEQVDKLLRLKKEKQLNEVKKIIYWDPKGMTYYDDPILMPYKQVQELGKEYEKEHPGLFEESIAKGKGDDVSIILYTSGTSGLPKGALLTHRGLIFVAESVLRREPWYDTDEYVSFIPPAWVGEQALGIACGLLAGTKINFPEEPETVQANIREIGPQCVVFSPRLWEDITSQVQAKMSDANALNRLIYFLLLPIGFKIVDLYAEKKRPNLFWQLLHKIANLMVLRPVRDSLGLVKGRSALTGGAPLSVDSFRMLRAFGINLKQLLGITETSGGVTMHSNDDVKYHTVGTCHPDVEVRVADDGEILVGGPGVFVGYYKNPEATSRVLVGRWFYSGDAGFIDEDGHVIFVGRKADLVAVGEHMVSPEYIEGRLKYGPYIKDAMVIGGGDRPYLTALIQIDFENVGRWAERNKLPYTTFVDLSQKPEVYRLTKGDVQRVNKTLPPYSRIRRYCHLHKEFDPDEAELTRTRKLRRSFMEERYKDLMHAMYASDTSYRVESEVTYRDGRKGIMETTITIQALE
jgi:long-chain acyl-CoA synthetase